MSSGRAVQALPTHDHQRSEQMLINRIVRGDERAFEALVRRYGGSMLATARRFVGNEHDAQDVVQESLLAVHRRISTFSARGPLAAWLRRVVINRSLMKLRSRRQKSEVSVDELLPVFDAAGAFVRSPQPWEQSADTVMERSQLRKRVREQIDRLPELYRAALLLRDIEELSTREAASLLGISEPCLKVRLHRARQALRSLLQAQPAARG